MATKPSTLTPWATTLAAYPISGLNNRVQPPAAWQTDGWDENEEPPPNYENWMKWENYSWHVWYQAAMSRAATKVVVANGTTDHHGDYTCDGVDDQVQIQAAIDAVAAAPYNGGTVLLSAGTFTISAPINPANGVQIVGTGPGTILQVDGATVSDFNVVLANGVTNASVINLAIDGNIASGHGHFHTGIQVAGASGGVLLERLWLRNFDLGGTSYGYGIEVIGTSVRTQIKNISTNNCRRAGVGANSTSGSQLTLIEGSIFRGGGANGVGVYILGGAGVRVLNNQMYQVYRGIQVSYNLDPAPPSDVLISGNIIDQSTSWGIYARGSRISISGSNVIKASGSGGIWAEEMDNSLIGGNVIDDCQVEGILLDTCDDTMVVGNQIVDVSQAATNTSSGIYIDGGARCTVTGNRFRSTGAIVSRASIEGASGGSGAAAVYGNDCRAGSGTSEIIDGATDFVSVPVYVWDPVSATHVTGGAAMDLTNRVN